MITTSKIHRKNRPAWPLAAVGFAAALTFASPASALQPLSAFLSRAGSANADIREATAVSEQSDADAAVALGHLLPAFSERAVYTRNEREATFPLTVDNMPVNFVITPLNQGDAFFELDVPIFDLAAFTRWRAGRAAADATKLGAVATRYLVAKQVVRGYYQVLGTGSFIASARKSIGVAENNLQRVRDRRTGGLASDLDVARAAADVERARQDQADAELMQGLAVRGLTSMTQLAPTGLDVTLPVDDLHDEGPLDSWLAGSANLPDIRAANAQVHAAEVGRDAARFAIMPTISGSAVEHLTNATAFLSGHTGAYTLTLTAAWRLDYSIIAGMRSQKAAVAVAQARRDKTALAADDNVYEAWMRVRTGIVKSRSAAAQSALAAQAADIANDRYLGGIATQLDVVTAQRDAFSADVARVAADADLAAARVVLRLAAGRPVDGMRIP